MARVAVVFLTWDICIIAAPDTNNKTSLSLTFISTSVILEVRNLIHRRLYCEKSPLVTRSLVQRRIGFACAVPVVRGGTFDSSINNEHYPSHIFSSPFIHLIYPLHPSLHLSPLSIPLSTALTHPSPVHRLIYPSPHQPIPIPSSFPLSLHPSPQPITLSIYHPSPVPPPFDSSIPLFLPTGNANPKPTHQHPPPSHALI